MFARNIALGAGRKLDWTRGDKGRWNKTEIRVPTISEFSTRCIDSVRLSQVIDEVCSDTLNRFNFRFRYTILMIYQLDVGLLILHVL